MSDRPLKKEDFTVGWISALTIENNAARLLRDEEFEKVRFYIEGDSNIYSYGRINGHLVVIACLPKGVYGTTSAAGVAQNMLRSFPNIRFGLMVGIGGGAPSRKNDIRLGDVVVSEPKDRTGGVIQYDFGKMVEQGDFQPKGSLNKPPTLLLNAIHLLATEHDEKGLDKMWKSMTTLKDSPRLGKRFARPADEDVLFKTSFVHKSDSMVCSESCYPEAQQTDMIQTRPERDDDFTKIHYGIIASGNTVVKNSTFRDKMIERENIMCFEMEAAGLMDSFPCIVVRGICDYADSHKNDAWQGYAAAVAAAYAKDLLHKIPVQVVQRLETAAKVIQHNVTFYDQSTSNRIEHQQNNPQYNWRSGGTNFINHGNVGNQVDSQTINGDLTFNQS